MQVKEWPKWYQLKVIIRSLQRYNVYGQLLYKQKYLLSLPNHYMWFTVIVAGYTNNLRKLIVSVGFALHVNPCYLAKRIESFLKTLLECKKPEIRDWIIANLFVHVCWRSCQQRQGLPCVVAADSTVNRKPESCKSRMHACDTVYLTGSIWGALDYRLHNGVQGGPVDREERNLFPKTFPFGAKRWTQACLLFSL